MTAAAPAQRMTSMTIKMAVGIGRAKSTIAIMQAISKKQVK